jgi:hypothetical protein
LVNSFNEYVQILTRRNYSITASSHTVQFTTARTESSVCSVLTSVLCSRTQRSQGTSCHSNSRLKTQLSGPRVAATISHQSLTLFHLTTSRLARHRSSFTRNFLPFEQPPEDSTLRSQGGSNHFTPISYSFPLNYQ